MEEENEKNNSDDKRSQPLTLTPRNTSKSKKRHGRNKTERCKRWESIYEGRQTDEHSCACTIRSEKNIIDDKRSQPLTLTPRNTSKSKEMHAQSKTERCKRRENIYEGRQTDEHSCACIIRSEKNINGNKIIYSTWFFDGNIIKLAAMLIWMTLHCKIAIIFIHDCEYKIKELRDDLAKKSERNPDVFGESKHHGTHRNQHVNHFSWISNDLKGNNCIVADLQASQIYASIQFLLKILGMKHIRYKISENLTILLFIHLDQWVLCFITNSSLQEGVISTEKIKEVSINEKHDRTLPKSSEHDVGLDRERINKRKVKQVKMFSNPMCQGHKRALCHDVFEKNFFDATNGKGKAARPLSVEMKRITFGFFEDGQSIFRHNKHWNKAGPMHIFKTLSNILYPPCPLRLGNHNLSVALYPVLNPSVHYLMRYEILRLRSYNQKSTMPTYSVSQLAHNGFYFSMSNGEVTCFNCERSYKEFVPGTILDDRVHIDNCRVERASKNVDLSLGTQGLTADDVKLFNAFYGNSGKQFVSQDASAETPILYVYTSVDAKPIKTLIDRKKFRRVLHDDDDFFVSDSTDDNFLDLSAAAYPLFANRRTRKETFLTWDPTHSQKPETLVNLGFFYAGYSDCARCFYCGLGLKYWRPNDNAAYQHARFRPQCKYNQFVNGQKFIDDVQRALAEENQGASANTNTDVVEVPNMDQLMKSNAARQLLAEGWNRQQVQAGVTKLIQDLGEECLVYDILLDILNSENRNEEAHDGERTFTKNNVMEVKDAKPSQDDSDKENANSAVRSASEPATNLDADVVLRLLEREHNYMQKRLHCRVCGKNKIGCIYLPCGHVVACQKCGDLASTCILCHKVISAMASIYLS